MNFHKVTMHLVNHYLSQKKAFYRHYGPPHASSQSVFSLSAPKVRHTITDLLCLFKLGKKQKQKIKKPAPMNHTVWMFLCPASFVQSYVSEHSFSLLFSIPLYCINIDLIVLLWWTSPLFPVLTMSNTSMTSPHTHAPEYSSVGNAHMCQIHELQQEVCPLQYIRLNGFEVLGWVYPPTSHLSVPFVPFLSTSEMVSLLNVYHSSWCAVLLIAFNIFHFPNSNEIECLFILCCLPKVSSFIKCLFKSVAHLSNELSFLKGLGNMVP